MGLFLLKDVSKILKLERENMEDEKVVKMAGEIQRLDKMLDAKDEMIDRLKKERDWVIQDFAKSLQFHSAIKTTLEFQADIIQREMEKALRE